MVGLEMGKLQVGHAGFYGEVEEEYQRYINNNQGAKALDYHLKVSIHYSTIYKL